MRSRSRAISARYALMRSLVLASVRGGYTRCSSAGSICHWPLRGRRWLMPRLMRKSLTSRNQLTPVPPAAGVFLCPASARLTCHSRPFPSPQLASLRGVSISRRPTPIRAEETRTVSGWPGRCGAWFRAGTSAAANAFEVFVSTDWMCGEARIASANASVRAMRYPCRKGNSSRI